MNIYHSVMDFGALGDGVTDDTDVMGGEWPAEMDFPMEINNVSPPLWLRDGN
jgi:hypothetical protein